jgi:CBS domain-containing protein
MKTAEIMTKQVHTIGPEQTLKDCAQILKKHHVNGLVVLNVETIVGVITKADIFKAILLNGLVVLDGGTVAGIIPTSEISKAMLPGYSDIIDGERHMASFERIEERARQLDDLKVQILMSTPPITVTSDTPIVKAGSLMILKGIKQLPVVDNGRLSGIVTLTDIINYMMEKIK